MTNPPAGSRERAPAIDEGMFAEIHGTPQWITLRGEDARNPILFILSAPGGAFSALAPMFDSWQRYFTLLQWDQTGSGATFALAQASGRPMGALTFKRLTRDAIAVAAFALDHLAAKQLAVLAVSGGSITGLQLAKSRPDLVSAYLGSGQIVHWPRQVLLAYRMALADARTATDAAAIAELESIGEPPFKDMDGELILSKYATKQTAAEQAAFAALDPAITSALHTPPADARYIPKDLVLPDPRERATAVYAAMRAEYASFDARALGLDFAVPMHFLQGADDRYHVTSEVLAYAAEINAPVKRVSLLDGCGASAFFMRDEMLALLRTHLLSGDYGQQEEAPQ